MLCKLLETFRKRHSKIRKTEEVEKSSKNPVTKSFQGTSSKNVEKYRVLEPKCIENGAKTGPKSIKNQPKINAKTEVRKNNKKVVQTGSNRITL